MPSQVGSGPYGARRGIDLAGDPHSDRPDSRQVRDTRVDTAYDVGHGLRGTAVDISLRAMRGDHTAVSIHHGCLDLGAAEIHSDRQPSLWRSHRFFRFQGVRMVGRRDRTR